MKDVTVTTSAIEMIKWQKAVLIMMSIINDKVSNGHCEQYLLLSEVGIHFQHHLFRMRCRVKIVVIAFIHDFTEDASNPLHSNQTSTV